MQQKGAAVSSAGQPQLQHGRRRKRAAVSSAGRPQLQHGRLRKRVAVSSAGRPQLQHGRRRKRAAGREGARRVGLAGSGGRPGPPSSAHPRRRRSTVVTASEQRRRTRRKHITEQAALSERLRLFRVIFPADIRHTQEGGGRYQTKDRLRVIVNRHRHKIAVGPGNASQSITKKANEQ